MFKSGLWKFLFNQDKTIERMSEYTEKVDVCAVSMAGERYDTSSNSVNGYRNT